VHLFQLYPQLHPKLVTNISHAKEDIERRTLMAKGQMRSSKEKKKPKSDKPKGHVSAYKAAQGASTPPSTSSLPKK
jgi:hypothetical protein